MISSRIQQMLPSQVCNALPGILSEKLNSKLTAIPQTIALTQILSVGSSAFGLDQLVGGGGQCSSTCSGAPVAAPQAVAQYSVPQAPIASPLSQQPRKF